MIHFADAHSDEARKALDDGGYFPDWARDFRRACETWVESVTAAMAFAERHPDRCLTVRYEGFDADRDAVFQELFAFLGCSSEGGPASFVRDHRINSSFRPDAPPGERRSPGVDWKDDQRRTFARIAGDSMSRWLHKDPPAVE
jgi:hypothetical protein